MKNSQKIERGHLKIPPGKVIIPKHMDNKRQRKLTKHKLKRI